MTEWQDGVEVSFELEPRQLNLAYTLDCGQAFRWQCRADGWWVGVVRKHAVRLRHEGERVVGQIYPGMAEGDARIFLASYLRLEVDLPALYTQYVAADQWMASAVAAFAGLRVLNQEPQETLLSYICSTANSVPRIVCAVERMSSQYGESIACIEGEEFYAFPTVERLAATPGDELSRACSLGWRGENLRRVSEQLLGRPPGWPEQLRETPYGEAKAALMEIRGVGAKIADCVCLFSLEKDEAVPVDTHIWAVAKEIFGCDIRTRTLTPSTYETVAGLFVQRYGSFAGWAQEYLYLQRRASQGRVRSVG